ncbi:SDR family oxidoreductase [Enterovirga rhinocerotis]|uniref:NAD(P)-dependent dehydrogenase (Short-subunit alcohol dehydrogenase family) n=1 Tax=Enterovirga rhinocerotis TaxID=1339210 RepID=A0A4R7C7V5_9HYPH|nr:SDR family oxidoreductase [Enterovirga rhinocerotis]TDR94714.1 NAD(P)-dependent dehydrogenase (short-subunit alcohol dehydrogenase family) [Enterovirga rhinocerotis]
MRLGGKIAVITGAGSGIGRATAALFAREGATLLLADKNAEAVEGVVADVVAAGGKASARQVDVSRSAEVKALLEAAVAAHGRLDILVNNAGYGIVGTVESTSEEDWNALLSVNVNGVFFGCKYAVPIMRAQGGGVIVNTASTTSRVGVTDRAAYVASKGAVAGLTRAVALDHVADNIRCNAVGPGTIESPYFDRMLAQSNDPAAFRHGLESRQAMNRLGKPEEIANAILFLASDESSFCTGSTMFVDGGWTAR